MESWTYDSEEKGYVVSNETLSFSDSISRAKNVLIGWELKGSCGEQGIENHGFADVGFLDMMSKQLPHDSIRNAFSCNDSGGGDIISPNMSTANVVSGDDESSSKFSSSVVDSSGRDSSLIDLQLGRLGYNSNSTPSRRAPFMSSAESCVPAKRIRAGSVNSQPVFCQVYGCSKDLSSSKDYHRRHKVCEAHSKTAKVIVNGMEQRFCQQCSRFHLLPEFDDGKRSCRKRLAGHNERRRKPHIGLHSGRTGRLLHSYNGSKFQGTPSAATSFICQDILPRSALHLQKCETNGWSKHVKSEDAADSALKWINMSMNGQLQQKSAFTPGFGKQYPLFSDSLNCTPTGSGFDAFSHLFHGTSLGSENFMPFGTVSTIEGLSDSSRALSLLSSQSQISSGHSSGIPMSHPLIVPSSSSYYCGASENIFGLSSHDLTGDVANKYPLCRMSSAGRNLRSPFPLMSTGETANSDFVDGILQSPEFGSVKDHLSREDPTINLLQLSSQLQRVEHQRQSVPVKQESEAFCCLRIT